jgi:hypothetical protein
VNQTEAPIQFESAKQFQSRPGYVEELTCGSDDLDRIVGKYSFLKDKWIRCHLNGCGQLHGNGIVLRLKDGRETHCGKDCAKSKFSVSFDAVYATYKRAEREQEHRKRIAEISIDLNFRIARNSLLYDEMNSAANRVRAFLATLKEDPQTDQIVLSALKNDGRLRRAINKKSSERGSGRSDMETVTTFSKSAIPQQIDLALKKFKFSVITPLKDLSQTDISGFSQRKLAELNSSIRDVEQEEAAGVNFISDVNEFMNPINIARVLYVTVIFDGLSHKTKMLLEKIRSMLPNNVAEAVEQDIRDRFS